jgi:hypothetical protein
MGHGLSEVHLAICCYCHVCNVSVSTSISDFQYPRLDTSLSCRFSDLMPPSHTRVLDGECLWSDISFLLRKYGREVRGAFS